MLGLFLETATQSFGWLSIGNNNHPLLFLPLSLSRVDSILTPEQREISSIQSIESESGCNTLPSILFVCTGCRQLQEELVGKSRTKNEGTWEQKFSWALYKVHAHETRPAHRSCYNTPTLPSFVPFRSSSLLDFSPSHCSTTTTRASHSPLHQRLSKGHFFIDQQPWGKQWMYMTRLLSRITEQMKISTLTSEYGLCGCFD